MAPRLNPKEAGAYYTPDPVVATLLQWAVRSKQDRLIDPACGDGRFIAGHRYAVGIEQDVEAAQSAIARAPWALVHEGDFFSWAAETTERFECAAGNPPFICYQKFSGQMRDRALELCDRLGVHFSGLTSSWAPFLATVAGLLKPGGRLAFVVPAEIGHAPYAAPLLDYLIGQFSLVHITAVREKLFPHISEDCWLLYAEGHGGSTTHIRFSAQDRFAPSERPARKYQSVSVAEWRDVWNRRLRPFLIGDEARELYRDIGTQPGTRRLGDLASVGIGYVSGANEFFHLRPSQVAKLDIPKSFLHPTVRNGRVLPASRLTSSIVERWKRNDDPFMLLKIPRTRELPRAIKRYLETDAARTAQTAYKCRVREPWYSVPDVQIPDFFLSYMSGIEPGLVRNDAGCTCTNSVHAVRLRTKEAARFLTSWGTPLVHLSCEIEGHPLGGGMLKLEPREAKQIMLPTPATLRRAHTDVLQEAISTMRKWRHYASYA